MSVINGYELSEKLRAQNAGFCRWGFCQQSGREYFIKEFLSPVYPESADNLSAEIVKRKQKICEDFYSEKRAFYDALNTCRTGNNILIHDFFRNKTKYYVVTDKVESDGTDPVVVARLPHKKKEVFIRALLYSIAALHGAGIVHADIKPDNILLKKTKDGFYTAKIVDFDAGFLVSKVPSELQGDFIYLSPEVYLKMNGEDVTLTEKIDIFALGILLHQYCCGELPLLEKDYRYAFEAVLDGSSVQVSDTIPLPLKDLLLQMLSKDPEARPSAEKILDGLKTYNDDSEASTGEYSIPLEPQDETDAAEINIGPAEEAESEPPHDNDNADSLASRLKKSKNLTP